MPKKQKDAGQGGGPNPSSVKDRDLMQRLNFLYQTSVYLAQIPESQSTTRKGRAKGKGRQRRNDTLLDLSRQHTQTMKAIGRKAVLRMDPTVKRTMCKGCGTVLIPGVSCQVRVKSSPTHSHLTLYICTHCKAHKDIPSPPTLETSPATNGATTSDAPNGMNGPTPLTPEPTAQPQAQRKKDKRARQPPLFERDVGHVVFIGNDKTPHDHPPHKSTGS